MAMFKELERVNERPKLFQFYTESDLWTNEHTSKQMKKETRLKLLHLFVVSVSVICALVFLGCDHKTNYTTRETLAYANYKTYKFPTRNVSGFKALITEDSKPNAEGIGYLFLPARASQTNKVSLMIILHGSGGTWGGRGARHAEFLSQNGVGALVIDTFSSRGLSQKDKYIPRLMEANFPDQIADAFGALNALQSHPLVDGNKIGLMGYSMGGISTILAAYENIATVCLKNSVRFALHIAFYAPCIVQPSKRVPTGTPVIALWGLEDGATPKSRCDGFLKGFEKEGCLVQTIWYEGAPHGWNGIKPTKFYKNVPNFAPCEFLIHENGQITEAKTGKTTDTDKEMIENSENCVDFGYSIGRHEKTNDLSNAELLRAIDQHLKNKK
jgi:dienelactone hydrolase